MHPDMIRELISQRARESQAAACQARLARSARKLRRAHRNLTEEADTFHVPAIPDYVDAMFDETKRVA
ncbi:MAG TPA: hypothetical protein VG142_10535 [Trebonia sp.]|jgi:hypothetical protein|nr:hypothetical protein [Trebonia sp.]